MLLLVVTRTKQILVKGRVLNPITGVGFENAEIRLLKSGTGITNVGFENTGSYFTDANGYFEISEKEKGSRWLRAVQEGYAIGWQQSDGFDDDGQLQVTKGEEMNVEYHVVPYGELVYHFKNVNCFNAFDSIQFYYQGSEIGYDDWDIGLKTTLTGCIDLEDEPIQFPACKRYYKYKVYRNGTETTFFDTINIQASTITNYDIFY